MNDFSALLFSGDKAAQMLHGQLSADVLALAPGQTCLTTACTPHGRMLANGLLICADKTNYLMVAARPCLDKVEQHIQPLLPFFKASQTRREPVFGANTGQPGAEIYAPDWPGGIGITFDAQVKNQITQRQWLESWWCQGVVFLRRQEQVNGYLPSDLNWDRFGVSYTKGCYTGQEIIARVHYRGKPKHQCQLGRVEKKPLEMIISTQDGHQAGEIIDCLEIADSCLIAARMDKKYLDSQHLAKEQPIDWLMPDYIRAKDLPGEDTINAS